MIFCASVAFVLANSPPVATASLSAPAGTQAQVLKVEPPAEPVKAEPIAKKKKALARYSYSPIKTKIYEEKASLISLSSA